MSFNTPDPPIYCECSVRDSFWSTGWSDKRVFCMKCNKEIRPAPREIPTPESSLIELIEAARFTHELSDTRIAFNKGIDTAIRLIKGRDDLHPSPDWDGLVELLLGLHPHGNMTGMQRDAYGIARSDAISIIRQHMGEKK